MKRYEFHSALAPEEVFARLEHRTKPGKWFAASEAKVFLSRRRKDSFWLLYTGDWPASGAIPFRAEVKEEAGGSLISGGFPVWPRAWLVSAIFFGFTLLMAPFFQIPLGMLPAIALGLLLFVPVWAGFDFLINAIFFRRRRQAALVYVRENLLK